MISRKLAAKILKYVAQYPVILITGPRQSGKTTLCRALFDKLPYVSLEEPDSRHFAISDPHGFLDQYSGGAVFDEIQRTPELFSYLQSRVDQVGKPGMFILTGSQQFGMMAKVSQSLAGRVAIARLLPFSLSEIEPGIDLPLDETMYTGFYPRIHDQHLNPSEALSFYIQSYIERDVRQLLGVSDLSRFEVFLRLCAGRSGQLLNLSALGNECGVTHNTAKSWLSVLEASYIVRLLRPYHANLGKRLIKTPKLYFLDVGLAAYLLRIYSPEHLRNHPLRGALFETMIFAEVFKETSHAGLPDNLFFYRDHLGNEVDLIMDGGSQVDLLEIKAGQTIAADFFTGLDKLRTLLPNAKRRLLVYGGERAFRQHDTQIVPWKQAGITSIADTSV